MRRHDEGQILNSRTGRGTVERTRAAQCKFGARRKLTVQQEFMDRGTKIPGNNGPPAPFSPEKFGPDLQRLIAIVVYGKHTVQHCR